jgi:hypothetical protein
MMLICRCLEEKLCVSKVCFWLTFKQKEMLQVFMVFYVGLILVTILRSLIFVPCIIRRSRNNEHYALICTSPLFNILAPTCFGSSLPSSGIFLDPSELLEIQIEYARGSWFRTKPRHSGTQAT